MPTFLAVPLETLRNSNPARTPASYLCWAQHVGNVTGHHAVYTLIQCTPLLVEKAGVAGITARKQERVQARDPLQIWNPWGRTHEVQNRSNQWLHKLGLGPTKIYEHIQILKRISTCRCWICLRGVKPFLGRDQWFDVDSKTLSYFGRIWFDFHLRSYIQNWVNWILTLQATDANSANRYPQSLIGQLYFAKIDSSEWLGFWAFGTFMLMRAKWRCCLSVASRDSVWTMYLSLCLIYFFHY